MLCVSNISHGSIQSGHHATKVKGVDCSARDVKLNAYNRTVLTLFAPARMCVLAISLDSPIILISAVADARQIPQCAASAR